MQHQIILKLELFEELIPDSDMVLNLTPDKNHTNVVNTLMPLMKKNSILSYSHGFNIVEEGMRIRKDNYSGYGCA